MNTTDQPAKRGKHTGKLDVGKALKLKLRGLSYRDIAKQQGVAKTTVLQAVAPLLAQFDTGNQLAEYKQNSADIFHAVAMKTLQSITTEDYAKAGLRDKIVASGICVDKARLISGESSANIAVMLGGIMSADPLLVNNLVNTPTGETE